MENLPIHAGLYEIICLYLHIICLIHTSSVCVGGGGVVCGVCVGGGGGRGMLCVCFCVHLCLHVSLYVHVIYYSQVIVGEPVCLHYSSIGDVTIPTVHLLPTVCV